MLKEDWGEYIAVNFWYDFAPSIPRCHRKQPRWLSARFDHPFDAPHEHMHDSRFNENVVQSCVRHFATIWKATSEWELRTSKRIKCATLAYILGDSHHPASSFETTSVTQDAGGVKWIQRFTHISSRCFSMLYICVVYMYTHVCSHTHIFLSVVLRRLYLSQDQTLLHLQKSLQSTAF